MVRSRDVVQAEGSARTEGARRATGSPCRRGRRPGRAPWRRGSGGAPARKRDVVLRLLRGESLEALSREAGVEIYRLEAWAGASHGWPRTRLKGSSRRASGGGARTRRSVTSGNCRWRSSCSASGPGPRSSASLWRCGGRDDERDDLRGDGALFRHPAGVSGLGSARARRSTRGGRGHTTTGWARGRRGGGRRRGNRTRSCWRRFGPISRGPRSTAKGHRKVHARLRILDGIRVARTRVLRVMRAHGLLSPHRGRQGAAKTHDGRVNHPGAPT